MLGRLLCLVGLHAWGAPCWNRCAWMAERKCVRPGCTERRLG